MAKDLDFTSKNGAESRVTAFSFNPDALVIVEDDPKHPCHDERATMVLDEGMVRDIIVRGVEEPILVRHGGTKKGVVINEVGDGRQRTRAAREANRRLARTGEMLKKGASVALVAAEFKVDEETMTFWIEAFKKRLWERYEVIGIRKTGDDNTWRERKRAVNAHRVDDTPLMKARHFQELLNANVTEARA